MENKITVQETVFQHKIFSHLNDSHPMFSEHDTYAHSTSIY